MKLWPSKPPKRTCRTAIFWSRYWRARPTSVKLYVFLCLNVNRHGARMVWEPMELANLLQRDRASVTDALEELCRREVCIRHPDADGRIALDRLSVKIRDRFWPCPTASAGPAEHS